MQSLRQASTQTAYRYAIQPLIHRPWSTILPHRASLLQVRHATHAAAGRANGPKQAPGRRLGAKKYGDEYVIPGHIIYRQRGTVWHPGENVGVGRDHTLYALECGYVKYYRNPAAHPDKKYIGVVFEKHQTLPSNPNLPRQRRLNKIATPRADMLPSKFPPIGLDGVAASSPNIPAWNAASPKRTVDKRLWGGRLKLTLRDDYSMRETNWSIGKNLDRARMDFKAFRKDDRWRVWREKTKAKRDAKRSAVVKKKKDNPKKRAKQKV